MSYSCSGYVACPQLQEGLFESWEYDNKRLSNVNVTRFIRSGTNRKDFIQNQINHKNGGYREVEVTYDQRYLVDTVSDVGRISCGSFNKECDTSKIYSIDPNVGSSDGRSLTSVDIEQSCKDNRFYLSNIVLKLMNNVLEDVENKNIQKILLNSGNFASDVDKGLPAGTTTIKDVQTKLASGGIDYNASEVVGFETMNNDFNMRSAVFGGEDWYKYGKAVNAACCGDIGIDAGLYATQNPFLFAYSYNIDKFAADPGTAISIMPGTVQMIWFNEFRGGSGNILYMDDDALKQGVLTHPDPEIDVSFDYRAAFICDGANNKRWELQIALAHDLIFLPDDMYCVGDRLEGINGILQYKIANP